MPGSRLVHIEEISASGQMPWCIDGVVSGLTILWSEPGLGKTFMAISMAASVASGRPWLGRKTHRGSVVYVAGEGGLQNVGYRLREALGQWTIAVPSPYEEIPLYVMTPGPNLVQGPGELVSVLLKVKPRLIIIDTLSRCFVGDENKQEDMGRFVRSLDLLRDHYSCDILVVHHSNREQEIRGSSVLYGAADVCWHLRRPVTVEDIDRGTKILELKADKLRERPNEGVIIQARMVNVDMHEPQAMDDLSPSRPVVNEYGAVQTTLVVKPTKSSLQDGHTIRGMIEGQLDAGKHYVTYDELRGAMSQSRLEAALSLILSYPGQWGRIKALHPGEFGRYTEEEVFDLTEPDDWE